MTINTIVAPVKATNVPEFPVLRQHSKTGRVYLFTTPMQAVLLAHGPTGPLYSEDTLGRNVHMVAPYDDTIYRKCSITLSSKD